MMVLLGWNGCFFTTSPPRGPQKNPEIYAQEGFTASFQLSTGFEKGLIVANPFLIATKTLRAPKASGPMNIRFSTGR
jgi:hypothetical protein